LEQNTIICVILCLPKKGEKIMKKYKWLIVGLAALLFTAVIVFNAAAKPTYSMNDECVEDGSCCEDENTCSCG
jgi:hypothetical protein